MPRPAQTRDLVAIIRRSDAPDQPDGDLTIVAEDDLAAVLAPAQRAGGLRRALFGAPRAHAAHQLLRAQRLLEQVHARGDCLPARPGQQIEVAEAQLLLRANRAALTTALDGIAGLEQHQVVLRWNFPAVVARLQQERRLDLGTGASRLEQGRRLATAGEALRQEVAASASAAIAAQVSDLQPLPCDGDDMVLNLCCLGPRGAVQLEASLTALDTAWPGGLRISLVGPLPPLSFHAVEIRRPDPDAVTRAADALGLDALPPCSDMPTEQDIAAAFRARVREAHPDRNPAAAMTIDSLREARALMMAVTSARRALAEGDASDDTLPPLAVLCRDGTATSVTAPAQPAAEQGTAA